MSVSRSRQVINSAAAGQTLDYVEITSPVTVSGTSETSAGSTAVITGNAVTYDGQTAVMVEFFSPGITSSLTAGHDVRVGLYDGTTFLGRIALVQAAGTSGSSDYRECFIRSPRFTPSAGTHTYSIRASRTSGDGTVQAGVGGATNYSPAYMRIVRESSLLGANGIAGIQGGFAPLNSSLKVPASYHEVVLLDHAYGSDDSALTISGGSWVDLSANENFTKVGSSSLIRIEAQVSGQARDTTAGDHFGGIRLLVDSAGTPVAVMVATFVWTSVDGSDYRAITGGVVKTLSGLGAGTHTIKWQAQINAGSGSDIYLRPSAGAPYEYANAMVLEVG